MYVNHTHICIYIYISNCTYIHYLSTSGHSTHKSIFSVHPLANYLPYYTTLVQNHPMVNIEKLWKMIIWFVDLPMKRRCLPEDSDILVTRCEVKGIGEQKAWLQHFFSRKIC